MVSIPAGSSLGRYRVIEQLGRGGMATVFRCHDPNLDRYVAVKVLPSFHTEDPTFVGRFTQEAQTVAKLSHPNILQIYDFGEDKGFSFIVSELIGGGDLQDMLKGEALTVLEVLKFMRPLAEALDYAHAQGIVHRDLKPANVLLDTEGRAILADFGLARMLESSTRFTQASQALGTPEYMAPEQAMGADADHRSDLYAFGIMIYQMLLGQTPFRADTPAATLMAHVHQPLPLPTSINPDIEPRLEAILLKSLAKEPDDRFQSAREMIQALGMASDQVTAAAADGDLGATAVLDIADLELPDATEAATAVIGTETGDAAAVPGAEAAPAPAGLPGWVLPAAGVALVAVVAVVAVLVLSGGDEPADPTPAPVGSTAPSGETTPPTPSAPVATPTPELSLAEAVALLDSLSSRAESNVVKLRQLELTGPIQTQLKTKDDLETITRGFYGRDYLRQQIFEAQELYKTLGMMSEDEELEDILLGIQLQQVFSLFDDESEQVYVISDASSIGPLEEIAYAGAYAQAILQQQFDIADLRRSARNRDFDALRAVDSLIGGEVAGVRNGYVSTVLTQEQADVLRQPLAENKLLAAPTVVQKAALFPQREGVDFVAEIFGRDGWEGLAEVYANPPISTEQILHPEKYYDGEEPRRAPVPNIADGLGQGWVQIAANVMGEFLIRTYLEEHLDAIQAADAAEGWGGDRYALISGPAGERLVVSFVAWDTFQDSAEFFDAYQVFMGVKIQPFASDATSKRTDTGRMWVTPDETTILDQFGPVTLIIVAHDEPTAVRAGQLMFDALQELAQ